MSTPIDNGGPAFPVADYDHQTFSPKNVDEARRLLSGMDLRDYFAAKAMHQMLHGAVIPPGFDASKEFRMVADRAYEMADAMLAAGSKS
jgi:hypothetical protein